MCTPNLQQLSGKEIPVATLFHPPMIIIDQENKEIISGVQIEILDLYSKKFHFTPKLTALQTGGFDNDGGLVPSVRNVLLKTNVMDTNCITLPSLNQVHKKAYEIGLGGVSISPNRYKWIEYFPWMYTYEFPVQSRKPEQIVSFDTLVYPFDGYVWCFTLSFTVGMFLVFIFIQKTWVFASGETPPNGWIFQGDCCHRLTFTQY